MQSKKTCILTVHDGVHLIYGAEDEGPFAHGGVDETEPSTAEEGRGHDLLQGETLLALTFSELSLSGEGNTHFCRGFLLPLNMAANLILLTLTLTRPYGEHRQNFPSTNCEVFDGQFRAAGEGEGEAGFEAHGPQAHHLLHRAVRHLIWDNFEQAWETATL